MVCFFCVLEIPRSSSAYHAPGKKATAPIYKVLVRPGDESELFDSPAPTNHEFARINVETTLIPEAFVAVGWGAFPVGTGAWGHGNHGEACDHLACKALVQCLVCRPWLRPADEVRNGAHNAAGAGALGTDVADALTGNVSPLGL